MKHFHPNSAVLRVAVTPAWRTIIKVFWIGYATIMTLCLLVLAFVECGNRQVLPCED